jgi:hypothetical protein
MFTAQHKNIVSQKGFVAQLMLILVGAVLTGAGVFGYSYFFKPKPAAVTTTTDTVKLPSNAVKISDCVPLMGEHWVVLSNIPRGPYYVTYQNKVIGIEYMFKPDEIPGDKLSHMSADEAKAYIQKNNLSFADLIREVIPKRIDWPQGSQVKTWDIEWSGPHTGLLVPHYDLHYYFISQAELSQVCPDATLGSELPPQMAKELKALGVPLP